VLTDRLEKLNAKSKKSFQDRKIKNNFNKIKRRG
jgi:hypothetical protein